MTPENFSQLPGHTANVLQELASQIGDNDSKFISRIYNSGLEKYSERLAGIGFNDLNTVLDAGCGYGQWSLSLSASNHEVSACDTSHLRINFLDKLSSRLNLANINTTVCDVHSLPYPDNYFDAIFCYGVIFLTPWKLTLQEFLRVLKPSGKLYFSFNDIGWYLFLWETEHNKAKDYDPKLVAARSFTQTLEYTRDSSQYKQGHHYIIEGSVIKAYMNTIGFSHVSTGAEGTLDMFGEPTLSKSFFKGSYRNLPCVHEVLATK